MPDPANTGKSWRRLITNLKTTDTQFDVDGQVDWKEGDHIVITPTDYLPGHAEEAIISSPTPHGDNTTITISAVVLDNGKEERAGCAFPTTERPTRFQPTCKTD